MNASSFNHSNFANRGRSHADSIIQTSSFEAPENNDTPNKTKLYELFSLIEKEFEALYIENCSLRSRIENNNPVSARETCGNFPDLSLSTLNNPLFNESGCAVSGIGNISANTNDLADYKLYAKKPQTRQQKWKTALRGPPGRLVTSLKVGTNMDNSKHRYVQNFKGHIDGIWHVTTAQISSCQILASASADQTAKIWSADDARCLFSYNGHSGSVNSISIRNDLRSDLLTVLTTSGDRTAHIWRANLANNNPPTFFNNSMFEGEDMTFVGEKSINILPLFSINNSTDEKIEEDIPSSQQPLQTIAPQTILQPLTRLIGHTDVIVAGEWLFGGEHLITASWDHNANVYDLESGKIVNTLSGHDDKLTHCNAHSSQKLVATASKDYTFRLWDFREPIQSVAVFQGHNDAVTSVVFTSMHHIISGSDDRSVKVWDLRNMRSPMSAIRLNSPANRLAVCNKYNLIAIPQDGHHISVYDLQGMRLTRLSRSNGKNHHLSVVCGTSWLTDNPINNLISCGFDKQIIGWKVQLPTNKT